MEIIKRKILLEDSINRTENSVRVDCQPNPVGYGELTACTFYLKVMLTQNFDDMGMYTPQSFISASTVSEDQPDYTILHQKMLDLGLTFPFMSGGIPPASTSPEEFGSFIRISGKTLSEYFASAGTITGLTDSKISDVRSYDENNNYIVGFDVDKTPYTGYTGIALTGHSRVTQLGEPNIYVLDAVDDANIGTTGQTTGLLYNDYSGQTRPVTNDYIDEELKIPVTSVQYKGEGWNETNTSLSALTMEHYLFGITSPPEVQSDVFIERGSTSVMENHLRLSEVESLEHLERYGNKFYNIVKN